MRDSLKPLQNRYLTNVDEFHIHYFFQFIDKNANCHNQKYGKYEICPYKPSFAKVSALKTNNKLFRLPENSRLNRKSHFIGRTAIPAFFASGANVRRYVCAGKGKVFALQNAVQIAFNREFVSHFAANLLAG